MRAAEVCGEPDTYGVRICQVGIRSELVNATLGNVEPQKQEYWCWAACIEMILRGYGINVTQEQVVRRIFGGKYNRPINSNDFKRIEGAVKRQQGAAIVRVGVNANRFFAIEQWVEGRPVILGYHLPTQSVGHAVVLTAATVYRHPADKMLLTPALTVRDPVQPGTPRQLTNKEMLGIDMVVAIWIDQP
jgi:hypothetical protein